MPDAETGRNLVKCLEEKAHITGISFIRSRQASHRRMSSLCFPGLVRRVDSILCAITPSMEKLEQWVHVSKP